MTHSLAILLVSTLSPLLIAAPDQPHAAGGPGAKAPSIPRDQIQQVVRAHISEVRHCYNQELVEDGEAAGRTVVEFRIAHTGRVESADIVESDMPQRMDSCLTNAIRRWRFPAPDKRGSVSVVYPFVFEPG